MVKWKLKVEEDEDDVVNYHILVYETGSKHSFHSSDCFGNEANIITFGIWIFLFVFI